MLLLCQAFFISRGRVKLVLVTATAISLARIVVRAARDGLARPVLSPDGAICRTSLAGGVLAAWFAQDRILRIPSTDLLKMVNVPFAMQWVKRSGSFFWISVFVMVEFQIDVILLSILRTSVDVAFYSAALTIIIAAWIVPQAYRTVIYPQMAQALRRSLAEFWRFFWITTGPAFRLRCMSFRRVDPFSEVVDRPALSEATTAAVSLSCRSLHSTVFCLS